MYVIVWWLATKPYPTANHNFNFLQVGRILSNTVGLKIKPTKGSKNSWWINSQLTRSGVSTKSPWRSLRERTPLSIQKKLFLSQIMKDNGVKEVKSIRVNSPLGKERRVQQVSLGRHPVTGSKNNGVKGNKGLGIDSSPRKVRHEWLFPPKEIDSQNKEC